jgi:outer membrane lipoprotein carrier protein
MRNFFISLVTLASCMMFLYPVPGRTEPADSAKPQQHLLRLQQTYREFTSLQFDFAQLTRTGLRNRPGKGNAVFIRMADPAKPGIMRWNYTQPDQQVILNDGDNLSIYTKKDQQLIVTPAAAFNNDITYAFFTGTSNLNDDFLAAPPNNRYGFSLANTPLQAIKLTPRQPHAQIKTVQLWFDDSNIIHRILLEDHFDSITDLTFTNIKTNTIDGQNTKEIEAILELDLDPNTEIISQ